MSRSVGQRSIRMNVSETGCYMVMCLFILQNDDSCVDHRHYSRCMRLNFLGSFEWVRSIPLILDSVEA